jgi:pilus assembly protein CpaE
MDILPSVVDLAATDLDRELERAPPTGAPAPAAMAYLLDAGSEGAVRHSFADLGFIEMRVRHGSIDTAIEELARRGWPRFLIVDISGIDDPLPRINRLAEISDPETEVIVVGERNDIVLYRDLKAAGVAEYFYKPLIGSLLNRALVAISSGTEPARPSRSGRLVLVLGVRGGVGATTIATNLAWHFAEVQQRRVLLLDLDLHTGDAALQLDADPGRGLREALDDPRRIDELFLERGVVSVTARLALLAGLEPLADHVAPNEDAILQLLQKVLTHFRYVLIDLPGEIALSLPTLLHMPSTLLLVSDGSIAAAREVGRWRELVGPNTPERTLVHVLNKNNAEGALPAQEMLRIIPPPDVSIHWGREIMGAAALGTKAVQKCSAMRSGMAALSRQLSGTAAEGENRPFWKRILSSWA